MAHSPPSPATQLPEQDSRPASPHGSPGVPQDTPDHMPLGSLQGPVGLAAQLACQVHSRITSTCESKDRVHACTRGWAGHSLADVLQGGGTGVLRC